MQQIKLCTLLRHGPCKILEILRHCVAGSAARRAVWSGRGSRHGSTTTSVSPTSQASKQGSKQPAQSLYRCSIGSINLRDVVHLSSVKSIDDRVTPLFSHVATCGGPTGPPR